MSEVITRFAPSPTGMLHLGSARTALFNWLYARHTGGKYLLRIEDTDRVRSTKEAMDQLLESLEWLGLDWDDEPVYQSSRIGRHIEIAEQLLAEGKAYKCYASQEELEKFREEHPNQKFRSPWRDGASPVEGTLPTIRLKSPMEGEITVVDLLKGEVSVNAKEMDDMVLLRADGTPTYMLAVVVDDHDMGVTHAIRGNDHFTNKFRQLLIYRALGWEPPKFAHVPLILGEDGAKLSKRHGATGLEQYRDMGILPEAMRNYLLRLGWSHGDQEIFSTEEAIQYFDFKGLGKSPSRFDVEKLKHINQHYLRHATAEQLGATKDATIKALPWLVERASTIEELKEQAVFLNADRPLNYDEKAQSLLTDEAKEILSKLKAKLEAVDEWNEENIHAAGDAFKEENDLKPKQFMPPLRAALSGKGASAGTVFQIMDALGKEESLGRIGDAL